MDDHVAHQHLDSLLRLQKTCARAGASGEAVQALLRQSLLFVRDLMTDEVFDRAMRKGDDGEGLLLLANRVQSLKPLLGSNWPNDFSFDDIINDLFGIANGDVPRVIRSRGEHGLRINAHALLEKKLTAHGWYKLLGKLKMAAPLRQGVLLEDYGVTIDAFNAWRKEARSKLTTDYVDRYLESFVRLQGAMALAEHDPVLWATAQFRLSGAAYKDEMKAPHSQRQ